MNISQTRKKIIENYIHAYNTFDIDGMLKNLHDDVRFENISNGQVSLSTNGIEELRNQAEIAKAYFKERNIQILDFIFKGETIKVEISYTGILTRDLPDGSKAGDTLKLEGKSIFRFRDDKIITIQDIS